MSSGKWEVAGSKGKKNNANASKKLSKKQKKDIAAKIPTAESAESESFAMNNPLKEHQNIFNLMKASEDSGNLTSSDTENQDTNVPKVKAPKAKAKKKVSAVTSAPKPTPKSERDALKQEIDSINLEELRRLVSDVRQKFPKHPIVWLKDILSYLQMKIKVKESDPGLMFYETGYPLALCTKNLQQFLGSIIREINDQNIVNFYIECLKSYAAEIRKGSTGYSYRILLQTMSMNCPKTNGQVVMGVLQHLIEDSLKRPKECIALLWCLQLSPNIKLDTQLKVWFTWMLPTIQNSKVEKPIQDYIFNCLDALIKEVKQTQSKVELPYSDFFGYLDLVFSPNNNLHPHIQTLMASSLDDVKDLAFSYQPEKRLRSFFPSLLIRLHTAHGPDRGVLLRYLVECLERDDHCFALWIQLYEKHLNDSHILLDHIHQNWTTMVKKFSRPALKSTLEHIVSALTPGTGKAKAKESARKSVELASDMIHAIGSPVKSAFKLTLLIVFVLVTIYVLHDVKEFGSFSKSRTGRLATAALQHHAVRTAIGSLSEYKNTVHKLGVKHAPLVMEYIDTIVMSVSSTVAFFITTLQSNFNYVLDNRHDILNQISGKLCCVSTTIYNMIMSWFTPEHQHWIHKTTSYYAGITQEYAIAGYEQCVLIYQQLVQWIMSNFAAEPSTVEKMKETVLSYVQSSTSTVNFYYEKFVTTFLA